jgi:hypothetical protein
MRRGTAYDTVLSPRVRELGDGNLLLQALRSSLGGDLDKRGTLSL